MNEIQLYSRLQNPIEAIDRIGEMFAKSGMFGCDRVEQGKVLAMVCLAEHKSPVQITRDYDIVEGKLRKKALAALAEFRGRGGKHRWLKSGDEPAATDDERKAVLELVAPDGEKITYSYSMADAKLEGLVKDRSRWVKRPGNMLRARCISNGLGMLCPEIFAGDEGDDEPAPAQELNLEPKVAAAQPKPANVVAVVPLPAEPPGDQKELAKMGLAPQTTTGQEPPRTEAQIEAHKPAAAPEPAKTFAKGPAYPSNGAKLPDELAAQVEQAIGEHAQSAVAWMLKEGWLQKGQGIEALTEARAKRIIKQRDSFLRAIQPGK